MVFRDNDFRPGDVPPWAIQNLDLVLWRFDGGSLVSMVDHRMDITKPTFVFQLLRFACFLSISGMA